MGVEMRWGLDCWNRAKSCGEKGFDLWAPMLELANAASILACSPGSNSADQPGDGDRRVMDWSLGRSCRSWSIAYGWGIWFDWCIKSFIIWDGLATTRTTMESGYYLVRSIGRHARAHAFFQATGPSPHEAVPLQRIVVLNMFGELGQRVARRRTFCTPEERHGDSREALQRRKAIRFTNA